MGNGEEKAGHLFTSEDLITGYNRQKKTILKKKYHKDIKKGSPLSDITNINLQPLEKGKMKKTSLYHMMILKKAPSIFQREKNIGLTMIFWKRMIGSLGEVRTSLG
ncbi:uncharacterized protein LOC141693722 isoform X4 [Apium graveolens]|uniref:uncharacterized protein LOC141693722 isoform X4 n=1 Tax=Apium graveolens TaxID=4045 RepID=UPI003D79C354